VQCSSKSAVISALWYYQNKLNINIDSDTTVEEVTKIINGALIGLEDRINKFEKARTSLDCN
jgi:predicted chitinase